MKKERYNRSQSLVDYYKYYCKDGQHVSRYQSLEDLIYKSNDCHSIDEVSILEVLNRYFMFADRTIFQDVKRTPWMGQYDAEKSSWSFYDIPGHGLKSDVSETEIADKLFNLLCDEVNLYVKNSKNIGILLSGGMDSRIVAGVLHYLMDKGDISVASVTAYTWGVDDCRDVVYSKRIADLYGWKWKHYRVDAENLWENFKIAGERGCEFTGLHLHAIPQICRTIKSEVDVMLAGSYGDSVGRAEYSGKHVTELGPVYHNMRNPSWLLKSAVYDQIKNQWKDDVETYHRQFPREQPYQQHELDYQIHYMRRMLNPCMELLNEKVEMHQVFTHPTVFGFMWSLDPKLRNDTIYKLLLERHNPELLIIPWARTGLQYPLKDGEPDQFKKKHHLYSKYMHENLIHRIESRLLGHQSIQNGIFNQQTVEEIIALIKKKNQYNFDYLEKISWLVSYTYLFDKYSIVQPGSPNLSFSDKLNAKFKSPLEYKLRHGFRKLRQKMFS